MLYLPLPVMIRGVSPNAYLLKIMTIDFADMIKIIIKYPNIHLLSNFTVQKYYH